MVLPRDPTVKVSQRGARSATLFLPPRNTAFVNGLAIKNGGRGGGKAEGTTINRGEHSLPICSWRSHKKHRSSSSSPPPPLRPRVFTPRAPLISPLSSSYFILPFFCKVHRVSGSRRGVIIAYSASPTFHVR